MRAKYYQIKSFNQLDSWPNWLGIDDIKDLACFPLMGLIYFA